MTTNRIRRTPAAAAYLGLSPSTLEKYRLTGKGPKFVRLGGRALGYTVEDLDIWIEERRQDDSSKAPRARKAVKGDVDATN